MPVDSRYTNKVVEYMKTERMPDGRPRPVTTTEIADATGMSRQAGYQWVESNAWRLREVGKGRHGARAYVLAEPDTDDGSNIKPSGAWQVKPRSARHAPASTTLLHARGSEGLRDLRVGDTLTVMAIRLEGGTVVADLDTSAGVRVTIPIA